MGFSLSGAHNAATEIPKAEDPQLRFFKVKMQTAGEPQRDVRGEWEASRRRPRRAFRRSHISSRASCARSSAVRWASSNPRGAARRPGVAEHRCAARGAALARHVKTWDEAVAKRRGARRQSADHGGLRGADRAMEEGSAPEFRRGDEGLQCREVGRPRIPARSRSRVARAGQSRPDGRAESVRRDPSRRA